MKVVLVTFEYPPHMSGGIGSFNYELAKGFSKNGIEVVVIAGGSTDSILHINQYIKVYFLKTPTLRPKEFYFQLHNAERIARIIEKEKPNVVQLNSLFNFFLKILKEKKNYNGVVVQVLHGSPSPFSRLYEDLRSLNIYDIAWILALQAHEYLSRLVVNSLEYIDAVVHVAKHVMYYNLNHSRLREQLRKKVSVVIYPGINIDHFEQLKHRIVSSKKQKSLIFGARLVPYKGIMYLLQAFELAWKEDKEITLNVFGDGPLRLTVMRMIKKLQHRGIRGIHYYGKVSRETFLRELAKSRVLVHPSLYEAASLVLIESPLLGTPVLVHKAPYSEEFVERLGTGKTTDTRDIKRFASELISMVNEDEIMYKVARSLKTLYELFDMNRTVKNYIKLYQKLI